MDWNCGTPCEKTNKLTDIAIFTNSTHEISGFVGYERILNEIYIVFRGTEPYSFKNWLADIDFIKTKYEYCDNGCQVHRGFLNAYQEIQIQVLKEVQLITRKYPTSEVSITGHSLGGALATHAMAHLLNNGISISNFYTFGCPELEMHYFLHGLRKCILNLNFELPTKKTQYLICPSLIGDSITLILKHIIRIFQYSFINRIFIWKFSVKICDDNLHEDPQCSNSNLIDANVLDHGVYMGYNMIAGLILCQL